MSDRAKSEIVEIYQYLSENEGTKIIISGHTDAIGSTDFNQYLSEKRAYSVANFFRTLGLSKERVHSVGYGDSRPIIKNDTLDGRNRRVEFKIELNN